MKRLSMFLIAFALIFASCGGSQSTEETVEAPLPEAEMAFWNNLKSLCGNSYDGEQTYMQEGRESWAHYDFKMHVTVCEDDRIHIPFHLSDDHSRTWMFLIEDGRLRFRHDHRHEDGTPEDKTLYGGYSDGTGTAFVQYFPADDYTIELLQDTLGRKWAIVLNEELTTMKYQLWYHDAVVFEGAFDIANPVGK